MVGEKAGGHWRLGRLAHILVEVHRILLGGGEYAGPLAVGRRAGGGIW